MIQRVKKAVNIFLDALNEGSLQKGSCTACAVGNLVKVGLKNNNLEEVEVDAWANYFWTGNGESIDNTKDIEVDILNDSPLVKRWAENAKINIEATDFTVKELVAIEKAFETNTTFTTEDLIEKKCTVKQLRADQIKGLEAVVKAMLEFEDSKEDVKEVFTKKAELIKI